jgi:uncharacterized protein
MPAAIPHRHTPTRGRLLAPFPEREVAPGGWLLDHMRNDLGRGSTGHLDRLAPDLVVADDIFGRDRLAAGTAAKDLGAVSDDAAWTSQFQWWNGETQGNWRDGWVHHELWAGGEAGREAARAWVDRIVATQDADGYLGIHAPDLRWPSRGEHGELWTQACLLRALLGYHRHTGDAAVLEVVRRAADRTLAEIRDGWAPFGTDEPSFGGVSHGLMFTDVCWELAGLTGEARYLDAALGLYTAYSSSPAAGDAAMASLLRDAPFAEHGVHVYEHWRALTAASAAVFSGTDPSTEQGRQAREYVAELEARYAAKLEAALTPTGAPNGDELVRASGTAVDTGYELCSVAELLAAYGMRVEATGDLALGDRMESLLYDVAFGMLDPSSAGVAYLRTDNSHSLEGPEGFRDPPADAVPQTRYRYSPVHREAACCCVPNAGRLLPAFARYQWLLGRAGGRAQVVALLYGPSVLRTAIDGVAVELRQETDWPAVTSLRVEVTAERSVACSLAFRRPAWAVGARVTGVEGWRVHSSPTLLRVEGPWDGTTIVEVSFEAVPSVVETSAGERLVRCGPLTYALPIPGVRRVTRTYDVPGIEPPFADIAVAPVGPSGAWRIPSDARPRRAPVPARSEAAGAPHVWQRQALAVDALDGAGRRRELVLVPMGATVLRDVAFQPG